MELATARLLIRPHTERNIDAMIRWNTDPELHRLSDDGAAPPPPHAVGITMMRWLEDPSPDVLRLALHLKADGRMIGYADLDSIDPHHGRCLVGLVIGERDLWGQGYGREALEGLLRLAFERLRLRRVGAQAYAFNERSLRLFDAAGFRREGLLRAHIVKDGVPHDEVVFGLLRDEWAARPRG